MVDNKVLDNSYKSKTVARNTIYNLLGYGLPLIVAVIFIPLLIKGLGYEKFGIINLALIVVGTFSLFDFGIGRTLTKVVAEKIGLNDPSDIPILFWTSFALILIFSLIGTIAIMFYVPHFVYNVFNISINLRSESIISFYIIALSIPIITTSAGFKGVLEAYQKFWIINIIRIIQGIFTFLGPVLCLIFSNNLIWIISVLILIRILVWLFYLIECFKVNPAIRHNFRLKIDFVKPVLKMSGWMTVSNILGPAILYADRFLIGSFVSVVAITYYSTPYEVITKLLLIPAALIGVLFPVFSANYITNYALSEKFYHRGIKFVFIFLYPLIFLSVMFAHEGLRLWVGVNIANESYIVLQFLSVGVLLNGISYIPFTFLQGIGRPDITAKIHLFEIPFYFIFMFLAIKKFGINGAAFMWVVRIMIDTLIMFIYSNKFLINKFRFEESNFYGLISIIFLVIPFLISGIIIKIVFTLVVISIFLIASFKKVLSKDEKQFIMSKFKSYKITL